MQQVNLYLPELRQRPTVDFLWLGSLIVGALVVYLLLETAVQSVRLNREEGRQEKLDAKIARHEAEIENLSAEINRLLNNPEYLRELQEVNDSISIGRRLVGQMEPYQDANTIGFSHHLEALARQVTDGVWLTDIELAEGGDQMALTGFATHPVLITRHLQALKGERVFRGTRFEVFELALSEDEENQHWFQIRSKQLPAGGGKP